MIRAAIINRWRKAFPHPAAVTRREESKRASEARAKRDAAERRRALALAKEMLA